MKKIIALLLAVTMIIPAAAFAAADSGTTVEETLLDISMDDSNAPVRTVSGSDPTYVGRSADANDKYLSGKGVYAFALDKATTANSTVTIEFDMFVSDRNTGVNVWLGSESNVILSFPNYAQGTSSDWNWLPKTEAQFTSYKIELNLETGAAVYYKKGTQAATAAIPAIIGLTASEIGFSKTADKINLDNIKVTSVYEATAEVTEGSILDANMDDSNAPVRVASGSEPTYVGRSADASDKYLFGSGIYAFTLSKPTSANTTVTVEFDMFASDRNTAIDVWLGSQSNVILSFPSFSQGTSSDWNWQPKTEAQFTSYKIELNLDTGAAVYYKKGTQAATAAIPSIIGITANEIGFSKTYDKIGLDNIKVTSVANQTSGGGDEPDEPDEPAAPCYVTEVTFEDADGKTAADVSDLKSGANAINIKFSSVINEDTVIPTLTSSEGDVAFTPSWSNNVLKLTLSSGVFEIGPKYTLTVPAGFTDVGGGVSEEDYVLNFERMDLTGVIAYYDMENSKSGISGAYNTREYKAEESGNKYLEVYNDRCTFKFDEAAGDGTLTIEFDFKNVDVDANQNTSVKLDMDGKDGGSEPTLFTIAGKAGSGGWLSYKLIADIKHDTVEVYQDGILTETITDKGINDLAEINGINFQRWKTYFAFDNVKAYYERSGIEDYTFRDYGGNTNDDIGKLTSAVACVEVEFENEPDPTSMNVTLYNGKTSQNEEVALNVTGRYMQISPAKGYFDASSDYTLTLAKGYTNKYGFVGNDELQFTFNTGDKSFGIMSVRVLKAGTEAELSNIKPGDTLDVEIVYVSTLAGYKKDAIVALTTEDDSCLTSFAAVNKSLNENGIVTLKCPLTVKSGAAFDTVYAYVWEQGTRSPLANSVSIR